MGLRCLVIDDDPLIGDLIKHFCSKTDLVSFCIQAENATDGLKLLAAGGLDLIFLDYNLPDMKGQEFLELMQAELPVIMVTSESDFAAKSYEYNQVLDFLVKPLSFDRFVSTWKNGLPKSRCSKNKFKRQNNFCQRRTQIGPNKF